MKKLLIPVIIAVLAGVGGGSGFAFMRASKKFVADSTVLADSLKAHPPAADSTAKHEGEAAAPTAEAAPVVEPPPMTPADSLRALEATRAPLHEATKGTPDATPTAEPKVGAKPEAHAPTPAVAAPSKIVAPAPVKPDPKQVSANAGKVDPKAAANATASVANVVKDARNEALNTPLPEQRLAKIFAAMSTKDAAKVMEQMPDADVRTIISMMNDRTAAAILALFPATRAAAITKGGTRAAGTTP